MLHAVTESSLDTGVTTVRLAGELAMSTVPVVRSRIAKAAAQCPVAVIVDVSELHQAEQSVLSVFATATFKAHETWAVPVLLCGADTDLRRDLHAACRTFVAIYEEHTQALLAVRAHVPRWVKGHFTPAPGSAAQARSLLGDACLSWGLMHLRDTAKLVTSELASNAIKHAGTEFDVMAGYTGRYLRIAVRDGSTTIPEMIKKPPAANAIMAEGSGRGLRIIAAAATHSGVTPAPDGKIVWAVIRAHQW